MQIVSTREQTSRKGPSESFTGTVWQDEIPTNGEPSRLRALRVTFEPGSRTAWHSHPLGQVLHVVSGSGLVQSKGQPVRKIHPGDTVVIAPNEVHWHGAGPQNTMVHLALLEGNAERVYVTWMEKVSDAEYAAV